MSRHFLIRALSGEGPHNTFLVGIAAPLPGVYLRHERVSIRQTPIQALAIRDADFDFSHIEPTGMLGRVVKDDATQKRLGRLNAEHVLEALAKVTGWPRAIEVIQNQVHASRVGIDLFEQILDESHEVDLGAAVAPKAFCSDSVM